MALFILQNITQHIAYIYRYYGILGQATSGGIHNSCDSSSSQQEHIYPGENNEKIQLC